MELSSSCHSPSSSKYWNKENFSIDDVDDKIPFQTLTIGSINSNRLTSKEEEELETSSNIAADLSIFLISSFGDLDTCNTTEDRYSVSSSSIASYTEYNNNFSIDKNIHCGRTCPNNSTVDHSDRVVIKKILADGWIYKKGSGHDFFISRRWKNRWAELALVRIPGEEIDIPAFLISWDRSSAYPSNFIPLVNASVFPVDKLSLSDYQTRFFIVPHVDCDPDREGTREFCTGMKQRDEWVHLINVALMDYQKKSKRMLDF